MKTVIQSYKQCSADGLIVNQNKNVYTTKKKKFTRKIRHEAICNIESRSHTRSEIPFTGLNKKSQAIHELRKETIAIGKCKNPPNPSQSLVSFEKQLNKHEHLHNELLSQRKERKQSRMENAPSYEYINMENNVNIIPMTRSQAN